jgi:aminopeptidase YwaD
MRKFLNLALILLLAVATVVAQQPSAGTPSINRLQQIIAYLASDALEGRRTGTPGANDAAHYIAGEFSLLGLRPGMQMAGPGRTRGEVRARYLQPFPYVGSVDLGTASKLAVRMNYADQSIDLRVSEDWMPLGFSSSAKIENAQAVFAGYGIVADEPKRDDYAGVDAKDKVVVVLAGTPDRDNPHGQFARYEDPRWKAIAAKDRGAKALILLSWEDDFRDERLAKLHYDNAGQAGLPVLVVAKAAGMHLLQALAKTTFEIPPNSKCDPATKMADGTLVARCGKDKVFKHADGSVEIELPDGSRTSVDANGNFKSDKFYGPKELERLTWSLSTDVIRRESPSFNVVGILPGSDPKLKGETIVIGAHYDHLGMGGEGSGSLSARPGIHHGADDNASGVAGLLELARMLTSQNPKPRRTIVFIAFSGEEEGLIGSNYYVNHPIVPLQNTVAMINMDMIGRLKENKLIIGGAGTAQDWHRMIDQENLGILAAAAVSADNNPRDAGGGFAASKFAVALSEDGYGPSDHSSFYSKQVPVLFFWTGNHEDYHKPSDTADKINYEGEARIISFIANIFRDIDKTDKRPTYTVAKSDSQGRSMGFRVYLGTIPNYADSNDGLKLDGVRDDSPAAKAGLKAGDKIVKMAGREVKNVYDYTYALGEMKAGQEYEVEVVRGSERLILKITPAVRKQ